MSIKKFFDRLDVKKRGYIVNRWLTNGAFVLLLLYMAFIVNLDGVAVLRGGFYVECPSDSVDPCFNPFYEEFGCRDVICADEFLMVGESIGKRPSDFALSFWWVSILVVGLALLLNHLLYNVKVKKNE